MCIYQIYQLFAEEREDRGQLVKCFTTLKPNTLIFFVEKLRDCKSFSHFFSTKNIGVFQVLTFEILTKRELSSFFTKTVLYGSTSIYA